MQGQVRRRPRCTSRLPGVKPGRFDTIRTGTLWECTLASLVEKSPCFDEALGFQIGQWT